MKSHRQLRDERFRQLPKEKQDSIKASHEAAWVRIAASRERDEEFVFGTRNINTETTEGRLRAEMQSLANESTRGGWVEHPEWYTIEEARKTCEYEAHKAAIRDESMDYAVFSMRGRLVYDFPQGVLDQIDVGYMHGLAFDARNKRAEECGGRIITIHEYLELQEAERPEEAAGHLFVLGPLGTERHGLFALGSLHLIQGSSGSGKTTIGINMLKAQAESKPFFGRPGRTRTYLIVWQDRSEDELQRQLEMLGMDQDPPPYIVVTPKQMNMEPAKALAEILKERDRVNPDVLFVEGLDMWVQDAKDMKHVATAATSVRLLAEQGQMSIIATVGMPKMKHKERYEAPRDRAFGSSAWARKADTVVDITMDEEAHPHWGQIRHLQILSRTAKVQKIDLAFDKDSGLLVPVEPSVEIGEVEEVPNQRAIMGEYKCGPKKAREIQAELKQRKKG